LFFLKDEKIIPPVNEVKQQQFLVQSFSYFKKVNFMAKYSKGAGKKVEESMHEMKEGKLKTGSGKKVTSRKQAIAIGLSEAREKGEKIPKKTSSKSSGSNTKAATKKSSSKKSDQKTSTKASSKSGKARSAGSGSSKSGSSKRGLASASKATRKRVASKGGKS
jgi:hypothetical protein